MFKWCANVTHYRILISSFECFSSLKKKQTFKAYFLQLGDGHIQKRGGSYNLRKNELALKLTNTIMSI